LKPMGLSQNALARAVHVAPRRINEIVLGKRDITADTDLRLARYFGLSEGFFLGLQMDYDLMQRRREIDRLPSMIGLAPSSSQKKNIQCYEYQIPISNGRLTDVSPPRHTR